MPLLSFCSLLLKHIPVPKKEKACLHANEAEGKGLPPSDMMYQALCGAGSLAWGLRVTLTAPSLIT